MIRDRDLHSLWARARVGGIPSTSAEPDRGSSALAWCIIACRPVYQENRDVLGEKARSFVVNVVGAGLSSCRREPSYLRILSLSLSLSLSRSLLCSLATRLSSYLFFFTILRRISHLSSLLRSLRRELGFSVFAIVQSHLSFLFSIPFLSLFFFFFGCNRLAYVTELAALCLLAVLSLASLSLSLSLSLFLSSFSLREPR